MKVDESLAGLKTAFDEWRRRKRHPREAIPANLVESARLAVRRHGPAAVVRATKIDRERLKGGGRAAAAVPTFSRLEFGPLPAACLDAILIAAFLSGGRHRGDHGGEV